MVHALGKTLMELFTSKPFYRSIKVRGDEHLGAPRTLYISNHADIVREAGLINYVLHRRGLPLAAIVVGDNLYENIFTRSFMRLFPTIPVPRGPGSGLVVGQRVERVLGEGRSVWLAQNRGRAKDGRNVTEPAILRNLAQAANLPLEEYLSSTRIIPVAVSAEYDPAIRERALQHPSLLQRRKHRLSDAVSCWQGLVGRKGRARVHFGAAIPPVKTALEAARAIDEHIVQNYFLWRTNSVAYDERCDAGPVNEWHALPVDLAYVFSRHRGLHRRIARLEERLRPIAMSIYAMPRLQRKA